MDGFFYVNKPKGITSFSVCHKIEKKRGFKKCGHNGTLDPGATGVMMVACGKATKLLPFFNTHDKKYRTKIEFGYETDTLDSSGIVTSTSMRSIFTKDEIEKAVNNLAKRELQKPPMYSAIKIKGQKMVDLARKNEIVDIPARQISYLEAPSIVDITENDGKTIVTIDLSVSKGFYVRSFARDLGYELGTYGTMIELNRTKSGEISLAETDTLEAILSGGGTFHTIEEVLPDFEKLTVNDYLAKLVQNGVKLDERQIKTNCNLLVYHNEKLIAVYEHIGNYEYKNIVIL